MKLEVSFWPIFLLSAAIYVKINVLPLLLSVVIHETGHLAAIYLLGFKVERAVVNFKGIDFKLERGALIGKKQNIIINLMGPLFGIALGLFALITGERELFKITMLLSCFNLLPFEGLDGGEIYKELKDKY